MAAVHLNGQIAGMTPAQFAALPPHKKLLHAAKLPNEFLMNNAVLSRKLEHRLGVAGFGINVGPRTFRTVYGRTRGPDLVAKRALNSTWPFVSWQQKIASSHLTTLWGKEPFKAKWAILARAYSAIRDQVGKSNAPLDQFLTLVCPDLGIIAAEEYLQMMSWECEIDFDGAMKLKQTSVPDVTSFDHGIQHTSLTEKDIVHLCARKSYISDANAVAIAGRPGAAEHGLLASVPPVPVAPATPVAPVAPVTPVAPIAAISTPANNSFLLQAMINPRLAASDVLGFDVDAILGPAEQFQPSPFQPLPLAAPIQWTGCLADIYNPYEGTFDFQSLTYYNAFDVGDISDPRSFDAMFGAYLQDGFMQPTIPESGDYQMNP